MGVTFQHFNISTIVDGFGQGTGSVAHAYRALSATVIIYRIQPAAGAWGCGTVQIKKTRLHGQGVVLRHEAFFARG